MPRTRANGIEIEYDCFGDEQGRPLLLIMGFGAQLIHWPDEFCQALAATGHRVVRFDNRDVGRSSVLDDLGAVDLPTVLARAASGQPASPPYRLSDMAADAAALADHLGWDRFHVCGASMGGMIAQLVAIEHPDRLLSLTSIMSTTGAPDLPQATPEAAATLMTPAPRELEAYLEHTVSVWRTIGSPGFPFDEEAVRDRGRRAMERGIHPNGLARQFAAIVADGSRRERLAKVAVPTLVIHGRDDPLVPLAGGEDTARSIEGAELLVIDGMGHDLPRGAWTQIVEAITQHTRRD